VTESRDILRWSAYGDYFSDHEPTIAFTGWTKPLMPNEAKELTRRIHRCLERAYVLLYEAHQRKAWQALGYETFAEYVRGEFAMSRSRAYQLLDQARVVREISAAASTDADIPEPAARELKPILPEVVEQVRARVAAAPPDKDTTVIVGEVVKESREALERAREVQEYERKRAEERKQRLAERRKQQAAQPQPEPEPEPEPAPTDDLDTHLLRLAEWVVSQPLGSRPRQHVEELAGWLARTRQGLADMEADVRVALAAEELGRL
jgi:hypothetical protein